LTGKRWTKALAQIPDEQRETIEMAYFEGYTQREIAELRLVPLGTVKGRIRIGMEKLREILALRESRGDYS
jgi:RNA polymerase sigma-70 factor (ECF subfamily)